MLSSIHVRDEGGEVNSSRRSLRRLSSQMFGNWTFGTLVFTVMVFTVTLKVSYLCAQAPPEPPASIHTEAPASVRIT